MRLVVVVLLLGMEDPLRGANQSELRSSRAKIETYLTPKGI